MTGIQFSPLVPMPLLLFLAATALLLIGFALFRGARGTWARALLLACVIAALSQPVLREEQRTPLDDIALIIDDRSTSQTLDGRRERTDAARVELEEKLTEFNNLSVVTKIIEGDADGTNITPVLDEALVEIDRSRLAGVILLSDGRIHDLEEGRIPLESKAPLHALMSGRQDEIDRKLKIEKAPTFAMVNEPQQLEIVVEEMGIDSAGEPISTEIRQDGEVIAELLVPPNESRTIDFTLEKAGKSLIEVEASVLDGELTAINNRATIVVNGIRDRLRVLLVSGRPYPGLRVWRNLLKADPSVDLVHFTILRPPEKQDGTPIRELALIAFPSYELFEEKIDEFDLVIFDRYSRRGLLPLVYLDNVARYVENGGALLEAAGPEFAGPTSLFRTPLARVLPGQPSGEVHNRQFKPDVTELGLRHPVTRNLRGAGDDPDWGSWFRHVDVDVPEGQVVMTGVGDRPLLALSRVGDGRVAQLLSDHHWLWARGVDGGGPQGLLLRRLVHWLMKEPELEEEQLQVRGGDGRLLIERQSIDNLEVEARLISPSGAETTITLAPDDAGIARIEVEAAENGVYRVDDGTHVAYGMPRTLARAELEDLRATTAWLSPWIDASAGTSRWLFDDGVPEIRRVSEGRSVSGRGWIGLVRNERYTVEGLRETKLFPAWLALLVLLSLTALTWWREGRV